MKFKPYQRVTVGAAVAAVLGSFAFSSYAPVARSAEADDLSEVVITGSRIARRDNVANSPIVTIDAKQLESQSGLNVEAYLNQLPAYNPAATPTSEGTNSDVQISSINSVGIASISLRGFGPNRSLTLVDGRRATPTNALMVVDVNSIPSSMVRNIEIISGGASAVYGADAMGGVSNFLLNRDFQGLQVDTQYGMTDVGDNEEFRASILAGTKFADGRGNVVFAAEYYDRKAAFDKKRDFYTDAYKDPTVGGNFIGFVFGENDWNQLFNPANGATVQTVTGRPCGYQVGNPLGSCVFSGALRFNADSTVWNMNGANTGDWGGPPIDDFRYSRVNVYDNTKCSSPTDATCTNGPTVIQALKYNETEGFTSNPQTRYAFMGSAKYDVNDKLHFASSARYSQSVTETFLAGTNASYGWEATVPYNATTDSPVDPTLNYTDQQVVANVKANPGAFANPNFVPHGTVNASGTGIAGHPVPVEMAILLNSRAVAPLTSGWVMETFPLNSFGRRATLDTNESWQMEAGLTYDLPIKDWTAEVYYSRGESSTYNVAFGNNSLARWRGEITAPDYGYHSNLQSNLTAPNGPGASPAFGSVAVPCTSGFYDTIFKADAVPSADCQYAVQAPLQTRTQNQQDIFEVNFQGGVVNLPAGEVRYAAGYQQRRNASQFNPDILQSTASFNDQVIGVYPTGSLNKQTVAKDVWAEVVVPVIGGLPFLQKVELDLGGRHSQYSSTDSTNSYMISANIQVNDSIRFRGGFNRATRAPNLGELYLPLQQIFTFGSSNFGDPCSLRSNNPFGAGGAAQSVNPADGVTLGVYAPGQTAAGATSTYLICQAQMGAGVVNYYQTPTVSQSAAPTSASFWINQIGSANLNSEKADTYTAGIVLQSHLEHPLLRRITATLDWYKINISDAILPYTTDYAQFLCYGEGGVTNATEAAAQAATPACRNAVRNQGTGGIVSTLVSYANQAKVWTSGVDFAVNWSADLADMGMASVPGSLNLSVQGTWLDTYKTKQSSEAFDPKIEWKGTNGPQLSSFNGGSYKYRLFTNIGYNLPAFGVNLRWQYLPSVKPGTVAINEAKIANNAAVAAGAPGLILGYQPNTVLDTKAYSMFGLSGYWNISDTLSMRFGIDNLFDKSPPLTGRNPGRPYDSSISAAANAANLAAVCGGAPGCGNPTSYSLPTSGAGATSGGFYDVLGRRYFVGLKARF
jgi:outer membrane receptor protein involved in Fe transport